VVGFINLSFGWCFLVLVFSFAQLFSAGPMTHLWVAQRYCEMCEISDHGILQGIIIGTEFPDIRYITLESRDLTHPVITDLKEVSQSKTPFEIGVKLHAWLDYVREQFITQEVYEAVAPYAEGKSATLLKFIEEEILADFYDGRQWSCYFNDILEEELAFAPQDVIFKWHGMIQWTMSLRPSWLLWGQSYRGPAFGMPTPILYNWCYLLPELKEKPIFKNHLYALLDYIEGELRQSLARSSN
jgi:hypothetical protein